MLTDHDSTSSSSKGMVFQSSSSSGHMDQTFHGTAVVGDLQVESGSMEVEYLQKRSYSSSGGLMPLLRGSESETTSLREDENNTTSLRASEGGVAIVTPKYHKEILDPKYHMGNK